jgi:hypothetical protein
VTENLLGKAVTDGNRPRDGEMCDDIPQKLEHAERAGAAAIKLRHGAHQPRDFKQHISEIDDSAWADGSDDGDALGRI